MNNEKIEECKENIVKNKAILKKANPGSNKFNKAIIQINLDKEYINDLEIINEHNKNSLVVVREIIRKKENKCGMNIIT